MDKDLIRQDAEKLKAHNLRRKKKRQEIKESADDYEDNGLHYDSYHGWIRDDK